MTKIFTIMLMTLATSAFAFSQPTEEQAIMKMERDILEAWTKGNVKTLERLLTDDYTETSNWGDI